jgi:hypothetical protein
MLRVQHTVPYANVPAALCCHALCSCRKFLVPHSTHLALKLVSRAQMLWTALILSSALLETISRIRRRRKVRFKRHKTAGILLSMDHRMGPWGRFRCVNAGKGRPCNGFTAPEVAHFPALTNDPSVLCWCESPMANEEYISWLPREEAKVQIWNFF